jgi:hypothetical protein
LRPPRPPHHGWPFGRLGTLAAAAGVLLIAAIVLGGWPTGSPPASTQQVPLGTVAANTEPIEISDEEVLVGVYVENIQLIVPETNSYLADFYIWYRWTNPDLRPHKTVEFKNLYEAWQLVSSSSFEKPRRQPDGSFYYLARHQGAFNNAFDLRSYPFGEQDLRLILEDFESDASSFRFITDDGSISIDPEITLPGYRIGQPTITIDEVAYGTSFGEIDATPDERYSRATVRTPVEHPVITNIVKYLAPILLVMVASSLVFQIPPGLVEGRIGLSITALLTLVAMQWSTNDGMPVMAYLTLLDTLYLISLAFILGSLMLGLRASWISRDVGEAQAIEADEFWMVLYLSAYAIAVAGVLALYLLL